MTSIFERALGEGFTRLHPRLRERFGIGAGDRTACVGTGVMERIWRGPWVAPFLHLGARRNLLFPETGRDVAFTIENYAYRDDHDRETVTFVRTFAVGPGRRRRFDATMLFSPRRGLLDYLGTHQHVVTDLHPSVDDRGGLVIRTGEFRLHEGVVGLRLPRALAADAVVREWFDDGAGCFRIDVRVTNAVVGPVFGYTGRFDVRYPSVDAVPAAARPYREEIRA